MVEPTKKELASAILGQQDQIGKLSDLVGALSNADVAHSNVVLQLQQQIVGLGAAFQIFAGLVIAASPEFRQQVAEATARMLEQPDITENATLRDLLSELNKAATSAPDTSPGDWHTNPGR